MLITLPMISIRPSQDILEAPAAKVPLSGYAPAKVIADLGMLLPVILILSI